MEGNTASVLSQHSDLFSVLSMCQAFKASCFILFTTDSETSLELDDLRKKKGWGGEKRGNSKQGEAPGRLLGGRTAFLEAQTV